MKHTEEIQQVVIDIVAQFDYAIGSESVKQI